VCADAPQPHRQRHFHQHIDGRRFRLHSCYSRRHYCHASTRCHCCCLSCGESILSTCMPPAVGVQHRHYRTEIPFVALKLIYCHYFSILIIFLPWIVSRAFVDAFWHICIINSTTASAIVSVAFINFYLILFYLKFKIHFSLKNETHCR